VATTRPRRTTSTRQPAEPVPDPSAVSPHALTTDVGAILQHAVAEAARLLGTDGAMSYLIDDATGILRFAYDAGITDDRRRDWVRSLKVDVGVGMFGRAVAEGRPVVTGDYQNDRSFIHFPDADALVRDIDIHSFVVAPLVSGSRTFGAMGTFSSRRDAFGAAEVALVRALADHAAAAMANADLIEELGRSRAEVERRAEAERALREIGGRIIALRKPDEVLQRSVDEAARLLLADGARIDILDEASGGLYWAYDATTGRRPGLGPIAGTGEAKAGEGISGRAIRELRPVFTGDYLNDDRFEHATAPDEHVRKYAIRSVIAVPLIGDRGPLGTLTVYTGEADAFTPDDARLIEALAGQAAIAMTNARLIEELGRSRAAASRQADAERALREIAARITAIRDPSELLQHVVDEAARLLGAERVRIDLIMPAAGRVGFTHVPGAGDVIGGTAVDSQGRPFRHGASGKAIATGQTVVSTDYIGDTGFEHDPALDEAVRRDGVRSLIVTPLTGEEGLLGVLQVGWPEPSAFEPAEVELVEALAHQAAIAIQNTRYLEAIASSREEIRRRARAEQALREIAARITAIRDSGDLLRQVVDAARRLLEADRAQLDLVDPATGMIRSAHVSGDGEFGAAVPTAVQGLPGDRGINGLAIAQRRAVISGDYATDDRFAHVDDSDDFVRRTRIHSVVAAPLFTDDGLLGVVKVGTTARDAYDAEDAALMEAFVAQAVIAIQNAHLIEELGRSREEISQRADAERSVREIAANISAIRDPDAVLQQTVDEARRLLDSDTARIDMIEDGALHWTFASGEAAIATKAAGADTIVPIGDGVTGTAVREGHAFVTGDYLADPRFRHRGASDQLVDSLGLRSVLAAPLRGESGPLGALTVSSRRTDAYNEAQAELLQALADQAAITIQNARLIAELNRSRSELRRRADAERTLREIGARLTAITEPGPLLQQVVDEARRLVGADGSVLDLIDPDAKLLRWAYDSGVRSGFTDDEIAQLTIPVGIGATGIAVAEGRVIAADDMLAVHFPESEINDHFFDVTGFRSMIIAPITGESGPLGALEVYSRAPGAFGEDDAALIRALADQAAIALTNSKLYELLGNSEARYRHLVQNSPDLVWSIDAEARFTFVSDTCERLTGWRPDELLGKHFGALVHESSGDVAEIDWTTGITREFQELRGRLNLLHRDGHPIPAEFSAFGTLDGEGRFAGANGSVRDMSERERLERELRESEERYRFLVENAPDIIFSIDTDGRLVYISESVRRALGYDPDQLVGRPFRDIVAYDEPGEPGKRFNEMREDPSLEITSDLQLIHRDGRRIPFEVSSRGVVRGGEFAGIHGSARDISERNRLERELRESEERYRFLVENSPDVVFATDVDGNFTYLSETIERMTGRSPAELVGGHFSRIVHDASLPTALERWSNLENEPNKEQIARINLLHRDGRLVPVEVSAIGTTIDGRFVGIHGATRDISERERLEQDLRRQAGELASSQERAHLARELHDSVTQALFSMTLVTRTTEILVDRDSAAAKEQLASLRDLQREALAEMRALIFELRPGNIEQDGLIPALRTHAAALQGRIGLPILVTSELTERLPLPIEEVLYRISQEALHNVVKHAGARQVTLAIERTTGAVRLRIADDGKGFDSAQVPDGHLGLAGMRARADKIGAEFSVSSRPAAGTTIEVSVPEVIIAAASSAE
jgi:PAS domain S-box-containing protein